MAIRKFLYIDSTEGFHVEQAATDELSIGKLSLVGITGVAIDAGTNKIINLTDPTSAQDAATKAYVDATASGLALLAPVRVATTAALTVTAAGSGVGKTLTANANGAITIDGVALSVSDRVLVKDQGGGTSVDNGVYAVTDAGSVSTPYILTRVTDFDENSEVVAGSFAFTTEGTQNSENGYVLSTNNPITVDTTAQTWQQFSGAGQITDGAGLLKTGNQLDVRFGDGITNAADFVAVDLAANPALTLTGTTPNAQLEWLPDTARGLNKDAVGGYISLAATPGLQFTGGSLDTLLNATGGLTKNASGLAVLIADVNNLGTTASGLDVVGVPLNFKVNGVATSANVTAVNLNELTGGGATTLHTHAGVGNATTLEDTLTANATVAAGDPVSWSTVADEFTKADAAVLAKARVFGVAAAAITAASTGAVIYHGVAAGILTGATPNTPYFLSAGGGLTTTPPVGGGNRLIRIGWAKNSTDLYVKIEDFGRRA